MTRQHTPLRRRLAHSSGDGFGLSPLKRVHPIRGGPQYKSPLGLQLQAKRGTSRLLRKAPALPTIVEEDQDELEVPKDVGTFYRKNQDHSFGYKSMQAKARGLLAGIEEEDSDMMEWDEETTLVALLQEDGNVEEEVEEDVIGLVEKLRAPMNAQSQELKRYMQDTIVPVLRDVKEVHDVLEEEVSTPAAVDLAYGTGLLAFDEVCKRVEALSLRTEDEIRTGYIDTQKEIKNLVAQLTDAYRNRDALWTDLEENLENCAQRARKALENIPESVEDIIARLEKKSKDAEKNVNSQATKQKMLKDLLGRL
ncbi:hypothetical protein BC835DRAFT_1409995 [Cytidiella melzeri]|nr:hypothetical protein BC835DRAFT_1409995 [Cytidiella melzeri]